MKPTKQHIAARALRLFNEKGFVNVRLQHIADAAFVSVGHLAYHFKSKDALAESLYDELKTKQEGLFTEFRVVVLFEDIHRFLQSDYQLQQEYIFFYLDTLELLRAYPAIKERHFEHCQWKLRQITHMIRFNMARGALQPMPEEQLQHLAWQFRILLDNWLYIRHTSQTGAALEKDFLADLWAVLQPFFSDTGKLEFSQLYAGW